jgi:hypothetical protein
MSQVDAASLNEYLKPFNVLSKRAHRQAREGKRGEFDLACTSLWDLADREHNSHQERLNQLLSDPRINSPAVQGQIEECRLRLSMITSLADQYRYSGATYKHLVALASSGGLD